ncbi:MAG TPA: cytochrome-c peroxidase [Flavitalea sp.]|nr:cytochrome-c peroxidase [Flavitalea sp.]
MRYRWTITLILFIVTGAVLINACKKTGAPVHQARPVDFVVPDGFPDPVYRFENNPLTEEGFALGRKLFYDGRLSKDNNFPCASCHQQFAAFATFDHPLSHGFNNQFTKRNAPGLFNMAWLKEMHWDGGINHIEVQPLAPITAPNEMAEDIGNIIAKLEQDGTYREMFRQAFGDEEITSQRMLLALTQFVASLVSADSKYDRVKKGLAVFNVSEQEGYRIFQAKCASCHTEPLFTDLSFRNTGLELNTYLMDYGRMEITNNPADSLKFKVPSLRNVALTGPYGHDGRFTGLSQAINHYAEGVAPSATLDPALTNGIPLDDVETFYLREFLFTLTDSSFIGNKRFAAPE